MKLFYAVLAYGGQVTTPFMASSMRLQDAMRNEGIDFITSYITGESLVQRGRNALVHEFLKTDCTHLLFVDTDIQFDPDTILRMCKTGYELVATPYPRKCFDRASMARAVERGISPAEASDYVLNFATKANAGPDGNVQLVIEQGCVRVHDAPTGCMLVKRSVFVEMAEAFPEIAYLSDATGAHGDTMFAFFDCFIDADKRYLSEDYAFCRRWQKMGKDAWCQLDSSLTHYGHHGFKGHLELLLDFGKTESLYVEPDDPGLDPFDKVRAAKSLFRYRWATQRLKGSKVALLGCGTNWGAKILDAPGRAVTGFDTGVEQLAAAVAKGRIPVVNSNVEQQDFSGFDSAVAVEILEYVDDPVSLLMRLRSQVGELVCAVSTKPTTHTDGYAKHDFTEREFLRLVQAAGWRVLEAEELPGGNVVIVHAVA